MDDKTQEAAQIVFNRLKAGEIMLAALCRVLDQAIIGSTTHAAVTDAIAAAKAAGITPPPLTK